MQKSRVEVNDRMAGFVLFKSLVKKNTAIF